MQLLEFPKKDTTMSAVEFMEWVLSQIRADAELFGVKCQIASVVFMDEEGRVHLLRGGNAYSTLAEMGLHQVAIDRALERVYQG